MAYTVADMFDLFQFSESLSGLDVCRRTGMKPAQMQSAKGNDVLTKKTNDLMIKQFGEDWNSVENLRKYQEKKNILINNFDGKRMKELRVKKDGTILEYSRILGIGHNRLVNIESGVSTLNNWGEYLKLKAFYKDDLLKENSTKKKNNKAIKKEFITFRNVGGHWEMIKIFKQ